MDGRIFKIKELLSQNLTKHWSVDELAASVRMSPPGFRRLFKHDSYSFSFKHFRFSCLEFWLRIVSLIVLSILVSDPLRAQSDIIKIDSSIVKVPVSVLDRDGRYVDGLQRSQFRVFENGVEQEISYFEPTNMPASVLLLIDVSSSVYDEAEAIVAAVNTFVRSLRPNDQVAVSAFAYRVYPILSMTRVGNLKKRVYLKLYPTDPGTMVFDAVEYAQDFVKKIKGSKAIILFSDGIGSGIAASAKSTLRNAEEQEALIYTIQFDPEGKGLYADAKPTAKLTQAATAYMRNLALATGGRSYRVDQGRDLAAMFLSIAGEISRQYSLGYSPKIPPTNGERRRIRIVVDAAEAVVRSRTEVLYCRPAPC